MERYRACHSVFEVRYPDVVVSCGKYEDSSALAANPVLIVEVLSPSTASIDRREKVIAYKQMPSLKEYMIVHQRRQRVELHRRNDRGQWQFFEFEPGSEVLLASIPVGAVTISMKDIYEDVKREQDKSPRVREEASGDWGEEDGDPDW
ncbi:MAG TPA: Uma2 family endonuclease [Candidatus Obscuribacterales bacterium]